MLGGRRTSPDALGIGVDIPLMQQELYQTLAINVCRSNTLLERDLGVSSEVQRALGAAERSRETRASPQTASVARKSPP